MKTIDKSIGGTFLHDENGTFVRHIPGTGPALSSPPTESPAPRDAANDVKTPTPRGTRRQTTQE